VKRYETFMNVNPYVVKHASEVLHSSASMALFIELGHMILHLLQQKIDRQTDRLFGLKPDYTAAHYRKSMS
jgi:hypothetical protein